MEENKKLYPINLSFNKLDKEELIEENIIFIDYTTSNNNLLLLSSNNIIFLCEVSENSIKISKKLRDIVFNVELKKIDIINCYFCNEDNNTLLLLCNDQNIYEYSIKRDYISHIYYNVLGDNFIFKMNCQKNSNPENGIKNFCIFNNIELNVWNTLQYNKSNILTVKDAISFSYDCTGIAIYFLGKNSNSKNPYFLSVFKFINEFESKEIFFKELDFLEKKVNIDYLDVFDNNIIMTDIKSGFIYILKNYPINKIDFIIPLIILNNNLPDLMIPFIGENHLYQYGLLLIKFKENKQKIFNICYKSNKISTKFEECKFYNIIYFKENNNCKSLLFSFDNEHKIIIKYLI